ncbi:MAG: hypothetical protein ABEK03_03600 [Candidatus Bipolaricaulia bacterium]
MTRKALGLIFIGLALVAFQGGAATPMVTNIDFPATVPNSSSAQGEITFRGFSSEIAKAEFYVADGRYEPKTVSVDDAHASDDQLSFQLPCTSFAQQITLSVRLVDETGLRNPPRKFSFTCGEPPRYNFRSVLEQQLPIDKDVPLNVFILDDGANTLSNGASFGEASMLGMPRQEVLQALHNDIKPALSGIWDQCGLGFEMNGAWVVQPEDIQISGRPLSEQIYAQGEDGNRVIRYSGQVDTLMRQATMQLWEAAQGQTDEAFRGYNVILMGSTIKAKWQGDWRPIEGFSGGTWPKFAVARWGALVDGELPEQMLATLAHELGHNFSLQHPEHSPVSAIQSDVNNLMKGSGVAPEPRANLLSGQCERARESITHRQEQLEAAQ